MRILGWAPLVGELGRYDSFLDPDALSVTAADTLDGLLAEARRIQPHLVLLDEDIPGGAAEAVRRLRAAATGPAPRFVVRSESSRRPPADGVVAVPRGEGAAAVLSAMTLLLRVPVRAVAHGHALVELSGRANGQRRHDAQLVDVSTGGMKLRVAYPLRVGEPVTVAAILAPGEPLVIAAGRIARQAGEERGVRLWGVELIDLEQADRDAIARYVDRAVGAAAAAPAPAPDALPAPA